MLASSTPPGATVRAQIQKDFRALGPEMCRFVVLPLGSSLGLNVVRAIVRGILLATGQSRLHAVVDSLSDGLDRLDECRGAYAKPSGAGGDGGMGLRRLRRRAADRGLKRACVDLEVRAGRRPCAARSPLTTEMRAKRLP